MAKSSWLERTCREFGGNQTMKRIKVDSIYDIPENFTGIAEYASGKEFWFLNGQRHREGGPAIERADGDKQWYLNDQLHREDGPAIEYANGVKEWWVNGNYLFRLHPEFQPFLFVEETEDRKHVKVLTPKGTKFWKNVPGLKELAENKQ